MSEIIFAKSKSKTRDIEHANDHHPTKISIVINILLQAVFIGITVFMLYNIVKSIDQSRQKLALLSQAEKDVEDLRIKNIELVMNRYDAYSDYYVEWEVRDRFNYSRDGESQVVIPENLLKEYIKKLEQGDSDTSIVKEDAKTPLRQWIDFVLNGI